MAFSSSSSLTRGPDLVRGETFFFGSVAFTSDDSALLADSPLQAQLSPSRGSVHFRADGSGPCAYSFWFSVKHKLPCRSVARRSVQAVHVFLTVAAASDTESSCY